MTTPLTVAGEIALREELSRLKQTRFELSKTIGAAIKLGDLRENADYHSAKDKQGLVEARIRDIEAKLANSRVIDISKINAEGRAVFGATVTISDVAAQETHTYQIVGDDEANVAAGKISISAPIARALIGNSVGEEVEVETVNGLKFFTIDKVEYI